MSDRPDLNTFTDAQIIQKLEPYTKAVSINKLGGATFRLKEQDRVDKIASRNLVQYDISKPSELSPSDWWMALAALSTEFEDNQDTDHLSSFCIYGGKPFNARQQFFRYVVFYYVPYMRLQAEAKALVDAMPLHTVAANAEAMNINELLAFQESLTFEGTESDLSRELRNRVDIIRKRVVELMLVKKLQVGDIFSSDNPDRKRDNDEPWKKHWIITEVHPYVEHDDATDDNPHGEWVTARRALPDDDGNYVESKRHKAKKVHVSRSEKSRYSSTPYKRNPRFAMDKIMTHSSHKLQPNFATACVVKQVPEVFTKGY